MDVLERKHEKENGDLKKETIALLKSAKKSNRAQVEAKVGHFPSFLCLIVTLQVIQMEYDLRAKQMAEIEEFEETGSKKKAPSSS
jgi:hypothetical protein